MNGEFVKELYGKIARPLGLPDQEDKTRLFAPLGWTDVTPKQATVAPLVVGTLTAFVEYVKRNVDGLVLAECLVHVKSPAAVELRAKLEEEAASFRRQMYLQASTEMVAGAPFQFGQYLDAEQFFIGLQSAFLQTPQRDEILALIASIRESTVQETLDDGVAQQVKTAGGIVLVGLTKVPNPVTLQPFRTFREVAQPASLFILRLQSGQGDKPRCALFEADGSAWKLEAVQGIAAFLRTALGDVPAIIA